MNYPTPSSLVRPKAEALLPQRKRGTFLAVTLMVLLWLSSGTVLAVPVETALKQQVESELTQYLQQLGVKAQRQDIQLSLPGSLDERNCSELDIKRPQQSEPPLGRLSYSLACTAPKRWQSRAVAQVKLWLPLVVTTRTLERGEVLSADMLSIQPQEVSTLRHGLEFSAAPLLGMIVKRRISAGDVVSRHLLQAAYLVQKGAQVTLHYRGDGFAVSTSAIALSDGVLGERISVQNISSGKVLDAIVTAENNVESAQK
ncbi:MAG TPA: flagellar basal body P-ring formation chaperone FlgA [Rheinheimera sp.]|uniref:flagellar basal body P-ring formation chaperone FlgA n=1 Tax=Rheinheimera sp. TaxID=1869214 RepID=UPI002F926859